MGILHIQSVRLAYHKNLGNYTWLYKKHIIKKSSIRHLNMGIYGDNETEILSNQCLSTHNVICSLLFPFYVSIFTYFYGLLLIQCNISQVT